MKTTRTIRCTVVTVDAPPARDAGAESSALSAPSSGPRFRPSDLLPWADPYIAGLVKKLQHEVRAEVATAERPTKTRFGAPVADLEWPWDEGWTDREPIEREPAEVEAPGGFESWNRMGR